MNVYDIDGNRVSKTVVGQGSVYYLLDGANPTGYSKPIEEKASLSGSPTRSYVLGMDVVAQADAGGSAVYLLRDGHGSTRALTDDSGSVVSATQYDYDAFGNATNFMASLAGTTWLAPDGMYDAQTGFTIQGVRYTDRTIGRFISADTWPGNTSDPISLHKYLYVGSSPITRVDPTGRFELLDSLASMSITSQLMSIANPILKPATEYAANALGNSMLGKWISQWLKTMSAASPALMLGADFMGGAGIGSVSATTGFSLEALLSSDFDAAYVAYNFLSISCGGRGSYLRGAAAVKGGFVFGAENAADYEEWFVSITLPLKGIPANIRNKLGQLGGSVMSLMQRGVTGLSSLGQAANRWIPAYKEGLAEIMRLSKDLSWLNQKINNLAGESYVTVFWDPTDGVPFGFDFSYGVGNAGSCSITGSYYWQI